VLFSALKALYIERVIFSTTTSSIHLDDATAARIMGTQNEPKQIINLNKNKVKQNTRQVSLQLAYKALQYKKGQTMA